MLNLLCLSAFLFHVAAGSDEEDEHLFEFRSSSSNWTLSNYRRRENRQRGYCVKLCGCGYNTEADGYDNYVRHFVNTKATGKFRELTEILDFDSVPGQLTDMLEEIDVRESDGSRTRETMARLVDLYCQVVGVSFDECNTLYSDAIMMENAEKCFNYCRNTIDDNLYPKFEDIPPDKQEFERCLDEFRGPGEFFDYNDKESTNVKTLLESFQKYGFVYIKNYFPAELMNEINNALNSWDVTGKFKNLSFSDYYSSLPYQLSAYEFRKEIVLPFEEPFKTFLSIVHNTTIMEVLKAYGKNQPVSLDFPSSIMSYPGATQQKTHGDHGFEASMVKVGVAIHDIEETSGPTSFCPCTHKDGIFHSLYNKPCGIRFHPRFIKAGTAILYDMSVKHRGSENNGITRRYLLDLSYSLGHYFNMYYATYPERAQKEVLMYREKFKNL